MPPLRLPSLLRTAIRPTSTLPLPPLPPLQHSLPLHTTPSLSAKPLPPRLRIPDTDLIENFLRGTGPGGQKINKTSCAVQLIHKPTGIVVKCQETRSRSQNRKIARQWLGERVEERLLGEESRVKIKERVVVRKKRSAEKKRRRKYRRLAEGERDGEEGEEGGIMEGEEAEEGWEDEGVDGIEGDEERKVENKVEVKKPERKNGRRKKIEGEETAG